MSESSSPLLGSTSPSDLVSIEVTAPVMTLRGYAATVKNTPAAIWVGPLDHKYGREKHTVSDWEALAKALSEKPVTHFVKG